MIFRCADLKRRLLIVCAATGMVLPSLAQRHGQPIIFSAPDTEIISNTAPSLAPGAPELPDFIKAVHLPEVSTPPSLQPPPVPVSMISPAQLMAARQELDRQKNWTLLTPAEILGVPTLENTLGVSERNAAGEKKDQTALERYFDRQQRDENTAMTNEAAAINSSADWSLKGRQQAEFNSSSPGAQNNSFFGAMQDNRMNANQSGVTAWSKAFDSQTVAPSVQTPEQMAASQAAAEDFQKLLQPGLASSSAKPTPAYAPSQTAPDSLFAQPASTPLGISYMPVSSVVIVPQGVTPLFGPTSDKNPSTTPVAPEWKRKLPPWMSAQPSPAQNF